jgi:Uncharacterised nucleotidyltransferase
LLVACATPPNNQQAISECLAAKPDWDLVFRLGEEHNVIGILPLRLQRGAFPSIPAEVHEKLQARVRAQNLCALSMAAELFQILDDFAAVHIEPLLIKGPSVSLLAYGDSAVRTYGDLDLIVRHRDILTASQHMLAMGFEADVPETAIRAEKIPGEYFFMRPDTKRIIELHTEPTFRYYPRPMRVEDLYSRRRSVILDGRAIPVLSLEDELLLNCIHGAKHFWERLIWIADIAGIVARNRQLDWAKAWQVAQDVDAERMLLVGLQLAVTLLGSKLPDEMTARIAQDGAVASLCHQILGWLPMAGYAPVSLPQRARYRVRMGGGGLPGLLYLSRLSLSPTEEDWAEGKEERRFWLWDALRRPFRLMRKYGQDG